MNAGGWFARLFQRSSKSVQRSGISSFYTASKEMQEKAIAAAKRDGEAGFPGTIDVSLAPYEQSLVEMSRQVIQNGASDMHSVDADLVPDFLEAKRDFQSAQLWYERKRRKLDGRPIRIEITRWLYLTLVALLMAGEVAVNFAAFEAVFLDRPILTGLAAVTLGIALLVAAHLVGAAIRQRKQVLGSIVVGLLVIALTLGLAYVRTKFIETRNAEEALFGGVKLDQVAISAFFFAFNLLFLAAAAWMAALRHDPDADYESLYNQYRNARERALECKKARDTNRQHYLADAQDWVGVCRRLVALYRENNLNARNSKATPRAWLMHPLDELIGIDEHQFELQLSTDIGLLQDEPDTKLFESTTEEAQNVEAVGVPT